MAKDTHWFPHDNEPTSDPKIIAMLSDYGAVGYGIWWNIVEMLHSDEAHQLPFKKYLYSAIARQMQPIGKQKIEVCVTPKIIEQFVLDCINDYELLSCSETHFFSFRAKRNIENKRKISEIRAETGRKGGLSAANAKQTQANAKQNEANEQQSLAIRGEEIIGEDKRIQKKESESESWGIFPPTPPINVNGFNYLPDGRSYIEPMFFFKKEEFNGLPEDNVKAIISFFGSTKQVEVSEDQISSLWEVFKTQELTEQKPYRNKADVYRHFLNWSKKQSFVKKREYAPKKASSTEKVIGVEFINDFSQCKMSDGTIRDLNANEAAMAKFQGLKPSTIK